VRAGTDEETFVAEAIDDALALDPELDVEALAGPAPLSMSYAGLKRYWDKQAEAAA
jgi:hypothetical protein